MVKIDSAQAFRSLSYSLGQLSLGLVIHPYQTMQEVVPDKVFVWFTLLPTLVLAVVTVLWRYLVVPSVQLVFSCAGTSFWGCDWLPFIANWLTFFCIYWQILLFYLLLRFKRVWG